MALCTTQEYKCDVLLAMFEDPDDWFFQIDFNSFQSNIKASSKYKAVDVVHKVVAQQNHLSIERKQLLLQVLEQRQKILGKLGSYPH